ncbi:hypothetical protein BDZ89DRAFT_1086940, partial [Hymenopellis radicata]
FILSVLLSESAYVYSHAVILYSGLDEHSRQRSAPMVLVARTGVPTSRSLLGSTLAFRHKVRYMLCRGHYLRCAVLVYISFRVHHLYLFRWGLIVC